MFSVFWVKNNKWKKRKLILQDHVTAMKCCKVQLVHRCRKLVGVTRCGYYRCVLPGQPPAWHWWDQLTVCQCQWSPTLQPGVHQPRPPPPHTDRWSDHWYQCFNYLRFIEMLTTGTHHHISSILRSSNNFLKVCKKIIRLSVVWRIKVCFHYCTFHVGMWCGVWTYDTWRTTTYFEESNRVGALLNDQ